MSSVVKSLRALVSARKRQGARLEEALAEQRRQLAQRQAEAEDSLALRDERVTHERQAHEDRDRLLGGPFTPAALKALDFTIQDLAAQSAQAEQALVRARSAVAQQEHAILAVQADIRRNDQRVEGFNDRIAQLLREREQAIEEQAEEEAEETAAARFSARQRQVRKETRHE